MKKDGFFLKLFFPRWRPNFFFEISNRRDMTKIFFKMETKFFFKMETQKFFFFFLDYFSYTSFKLFLLIDIAVVRCRDTT